MGTKRDKKEQDLANQQNMWSTAAYQAYLKSLEPSKLQQRLETEALNFLDDTEGGVKDITQVRGMSPYLDLYNVAKRGQVGERYGEGALTLAGENSGGWGKLMKAHQQAKREQDAAGQLTNAFAAKNAEVRGSAMPLINAYQNQVMGSANIAQQGMGNAGSIWMQHRQTKRPSFWSQLWSGVQQGAQSAAVAGGV